MKGIASAFDAGVPTAAAMRGLLRTLFLGHASPVMLSQITRRLNLSIDPLAHVVTLKGQALDLPPREFDVLDALALEAGHVISTDALIARVWDAEYDGEPQVVYVHIRWLREKLEDDPNQPRRIITVRGVGYKLEPWAA